MGKGKLGGTKAKIRGKVGDIIYQTKRDESGKLVQSSYVAPVVVTPSNTEPQAKARAIMGMIERMFHALPQVIKDAFYFIAPGELAFQHFSRINYDYVRSQFSLMPGTISSINWKNKYDLAAPAGAWLLCDGTLPEISFTNTNWWEEFNNWLRWYYFPKDVGFRISDLYNHMHMQADDIIRFYVFVEYADGMPSKVVYGDFKLIPGISLNSWLPYNYGFDIWQPLTDTEWRLQASQVGSSVSVRLSCPQDDLKRIIACACLQVLRPTERGTLFSSCRFQWFQTYSSTLYHITPVYEVWDSWLNDINSYEK